MLSRNIRELNDMALPVKVAGLTGGIASGKTVATTALRRAGFFVVDADEVSRELFARGTDGEAELVRAFPEAANGGMLDRRALRKIIAKDKNAQKRLNALTHPAIVREVKSRIESAGVPAVLSAPLLFETALSALCGATVCITCPKRVRVRRIIERDGITEAEALAIIDAQIPDTERATLADCCVPSDIDKALFEKEIVALFTALLK